MAKALPWRRGEENAESGAADLTNLGFDQAKVREALRAIGNPADKEAAINWLLDHGEEDRGGTVELKHCPHVDEFSHPFAAQFLGCATRGTILRLDVRPLTASRSVVTIPMVS
eukprot:Skav204411  [mRNA]  locus=scaffold398:140770:144271:- [translate_table: standard]